MEEDQEIQATKRTAEDLFALDFKVTFNLNKL